MKHCSGCSILSAFRAYQKARSHTKKRCHWEHWLVGGVPKCLIPLQMMFQMKRQDFRIQALLSVLERACTLKTPQTARFQPDNFCTTSEVSAKWYTKWTPCAQPVSGYNMAISAMIMHQKIPQPEHHQTLPRTASLYLLINRKIKHDAGFIKNINLARKKRFLVLKFSLFEGTSESEPQDAPQVFWWYLFWSRKYCQNCIITFAHPPSVCLQAAH